MTFFQSLWFVVEIFFFVAYLVVLFQIVGDLFRDRSLSGWARALWIVFLVFVPLITALVYLIARGRDMGRRQAEVQQQAREATDEYIRTVAGSSPAAEIAQAKALLDSGAITAAEFERIKARALA